ncbi:hypothetical protein Q765_12940 [Flavobacterium rivuli WB 3.3-2 = DSM 21788]|uniref:Secretion system C-terminal sorting domain-containing protein n=1 Tax=Flavobacterium rivuli WB 3.3-2 = DSM 21788 TaxID=1121895 RepID=A0A0A2M002_9FLAO|nr:T9SS type A sorting domain-containing protein [Flavobacterium rivuli]KGO85967.1 hypothetical protein Q765_12940 [Flavobacterium rivuli WB 3.3-2 = DSM 21788]
MHKLNKIIILLIVMGFRLSMLQAQTTILDQTLLTQQSFNTFTPVSVTGTQGWNFSATYGAVCSGYAAGQSYENEDWLIGPVMDLSQADNVLLTFSHTRGSAPVMNVGVEQGWYKVYATAYYTGVPTTTEWVELEGLNQDITTAWQYVSSGQLSIPDAARSVSSRIAFRYISGATVSATWEIKNVRVTGETQNTNPGTESDFKITNWNTEWLGCTQFGPEDESQQIDNVVAAMLSMNSDVYCLQEVSNTVLSPSIESIVALLGSEQWGGAIVPVNTGDCNQRQGIIYKKSKVQLVNSSEMSTGNAAQGNTYRYNWSGGRYPAVYTINLIAGNALIPVSLINIHAKAEDGVAESYTRRLGGAESLKTILDGATYNTKNVIVIGDFNDYLIGTSSNSCQCTTSPFQNFMDDDDNYTGITSTLTDVDTRFGIHPIIENIIISDELADNYVVNSTAQEVTVPQNIFNYYNTTSNHLPVSAVFRFSTLGVEANPVEKAWAIYPNPVKELLNITASHALNNTVVEVYDLTGRQVFYSKLNNNTINVSALPAGMYILKMDNKTGKFIKQ